MTVAMVFAVVGAIVAGCAGYALACYLHDLGDHGKHEYQWADGSIHESEYQPPPTVAVCRSCHEPIDRDGVVWVHRATASSFSTLAGVHEAEPWFVRSDWP